MKLTILGPNLPAEAPATFVVHKAGCRDLKRGYATWADKSTEDHETLRALVESFYGPPAGSFYEEHWGDDIPEDPWLDYADEFHLMPCCESLPVVEKTS